MNTKVYDNKIKKRASLRECVEFAFQDEDICRGEGDKKLIGFFDRGDAKKPTKEEVYKLLRSDDGTWNKDTEYRYEVLAYSWDENDPETIFEECMWFFFCHYLEHVFLYSVHENEDSIYVHLLIRKVEGCSLPEKFESLDGITASQEDYLEAMNYLMY